MKFPRLTIQNFLAITEAEISLADRGYVLIQGENLDDTSAKSNGAGKSSIADALCWVLFGETARGASGDDVINEGVGKNTAVTVEIEDGDERYRIARHRKHKPFKNSIQVRQHNKATGDFDIDLTKGTDKLTQPVVDKIVGSSLEVFRAAVYAGQELMPDLPAMTDKNLKVLIEEAAGVTVLEEAYKVAREELAAARQKVDKVQTEIDRLENQSAFIDGQIVDAKASFDAWDLNRKAKLTAGKAELRTRVEEVKKLDKDIADAGLAEIEAKIGDCDVKLSSLKAEGDERARLQGNAYRCEVAANAARDHVRDLTKECGRAKAELEAVEHKIGCPCDECGRAITEAEIAKARQAAERRVKTTLDNLREAKTALDDAQKRAGTTTDALAEFERTMTDPSAISAQRAALALRKSAVERLQRERADNAALIRRRGDELKLLMAEDNPHSRAINDLAERRKALDTQLSDLLTKQRELAEEVEYAEVVQRVFAPSGVRAHVLDEVTPFLNARTAVYLDTLSDGNILANWATLVKNAKGELTEKFSIEVEHAKGGKKFKAISGGEKRKVRISTALALQDLVATRASKPIDLFIGDEIDDALDQAGLERLTMILEEKARERGSVFIISHNDLKDWVSQVLTVRKSGGATTIVEETL